MAKKSLNKIIKEHSFLEELAQPAQRALARAGYVRLEQFTKVTEADIMELHGMGPNALKKIRQTLKAQGKSFVK
jgi:hypothetical protein